MVIESLFKFLTEQNMTYCMGGTGIIFSRRLLFEIGPKLAPCASSELLTEHEDIEIGRCVWKALDYPIRINKYKDF